MNQLALPGFDVRPEYTCPLCGEVAALFGQFSPLLPWGVCRECAEKYPYPAELFVPNTRRNRDREPLMIDPRPELSEARERRVALEEMLRCAVDPTRIARPVVKYNITGMELRNPVRRSRMRQFNAMARQAQKALETNQMRLPVCDRCGCVHDRFSELLPGHGDYHSKCQHCEDEETVEALFRHRGIFGQDDDESVMDRLFAAFPAMFERGVLPDYYLKLQMRQRLMKETT